MAPALRFIYIDTVTDFQEVGCYPAGGYWRLAYVAPLPALALIITPGIDLEDLLNCTVGVYTGLCELRQPGTKNAWGHYPNHPQSKISIVATFDNINARKTLSELLATGPQYSEALLSM